MDQASPKVEGIRPENRAPSRPEAELRTASDAILCWPIPPAWEGLLELLNVESTSEGDLRW